MKTNPKEQIPIIRAGTIRMAVATAAMLLTAPPVRAAEPGTALVFTKASGYERLTEWLQITAPQLDRQDDLSRYGSPPSAVFPQRLVQTTNTQLRNLG